MDIKERITKNETTAKQIQTSLQQLEQDRQNLLQELIRLDGQHRLLKEMEQEDVLAK